MTIYEVVFVDQNGAQNSSRLFQTIRAARNWCKWLRKQAYIADTIIYKGGSGGEVVQ